MKHFKLLYFLSIGVSILTVILLSAFLFPSQQFWKSMLCILLPMLILGCSLLIINFLRIAFIQNQIHQMLQTIKEFDMESPTNISFQKSSIPLLNEINKYLAVLIDRIQNNYLANKQFIQNASHELQTPLTVIKGHVDLLIQSPQIGEKELESLAIVLQNIKRVSKLNNALILLSKIEQQRFGDTELIDFTKVTKEALINYNDHIQIKELETQTDFLTPFQIEMSNTLSEILISNLIQNAIRHNTDKGFIRIKTTADQIRISNSGKILSQNPTMLFQRFMRESDSEQGLGLGLAIVQQICKQSNLDVKYFFENKVHHLILKKK